MPNAAPAEMEPVAGASGGAGGAEEGDGTFVGPTTAGETIETKSPVVLEEENKDASFNSTGSMVSWSRAPSLSTAFMEAATAAALSACACAAVAALAEAGTGTAITSDKTSRPVPPSTRGAAAAATMAEAGAAAKARRLDAVTGNGLLMGTEEL